MEFTRVATALAEERVLADRIGRPGVGEVERGKILCGTISTAMCEQVLPTLSSHYDSVGLYYR